MENVSNNPLQKHFRQPKLFIRLPSGGSYYPDGTFENNENMEFPIYPMTAKDEIMFKTPDALLNGQSIVSVIENCVPNIKSGWMVPSIDIDAILVAIRIATYGDKMDLEFKIPNTNEERTFEIKLTPLLDTLTGQTYDSIVEYENLTFEIVPGNYKTFTDQSLKTFEEQRLFATVNDDEISDSDKLKIFNESFGRLTDINLNSIFDQVKSITVAGEQTVVNPSHIKEFLENASTQVYKALLDHIDIQRKKFQIKPFEITTTEEDRENGAPESFTVPFTFDQANFFG